LVGTTWHADQARYRGVEWRALCQTVAV